MKTKMRLSQNELSGMCEFFGKKKNTHTQLTVSSNKVKELTPALARIF